MSEWGPENEDEPTPFDALVCGAGIIVAAIVVAGLLYWTCQAWFWLERISS